HRVAFTEGDLIGLRITNLHHEDVYVVVLDFGLSHRIYQVYPPRNARPRHQPGPYEFGTQPGQEIRLGFPRGGFARADGLEYFKLIAATEEVDFRVLEQEGTTRSVSMLEHILGQAREGTRDVEEPLPTGIAWTTSLCSFALLKKAAPTSA